MMTSSKKGSAVWDLELGKKLMTLQDTDTNLTCLISPDQKMAFTAVAKEREGGGYAREADGDCIRIWHLPVIPDSFLKGRLRLKKALLILFFSDLHKMKSVNLVRFPDALKKEI